MNPNLAALVPLASRGRRIPECFAYRRAWFIFLEHLKAYVLFGSSRCYHPVPKTFDIVPGSHNSHVVFRMNISE